MYSKEEKVKLVEEWEKSGESVSSWSKQQGIAKSTLRGWVNKKKKEHNPFLELKEEASSIEIRVGKISIVIKGA